MTDSGYLWLSAALSLIGVASLAIAIVVALRRTRTTQSSPALVPAPVCGGAVVRLEFTQSLDPALFAQASDEEVLAFANANLRDLVADGSNITLQLLREWAARYDVTVAPSAAGRVALRAGRAVIQRHSSGRLFPHLVNSESRQITEVMKEVGGARKVLAGAAAASTIVVSAAHMIATADLARTLRLVDQKLDLLLAFRRIDQQAALERIYTAAKELLASPLDEVQHMELWRLRGELRELRATWRREFEHHLLQVENPAEKAWIDRTFTRQSSEDRRITGRISEGQIQLAMLEYSLRLDRVLAAASGSLEVSFVTLADELTAIERVGTLLRDKAGFISETRRDAVQPMIDGIDMIVTGYRGLLPSHREMPALAEVTATPAVPLLDRRLREAAAPELPDANAGPAA